MAFTLFDASYEYGYDAAAANDASYFSPFSNSGGNHQEGLLQALVPSPCQEEETDYGHGSWAEPLDSEGEQVPYSGSTGTWLSGFNSVFGDCGAGGNYVSLSNGMDANNEGDGDSKNMEAIVNPSEDVENHPSGYDLWSCYDWWLEFGGDKDSSSYGGEEPEVSYGHEIGVCESMFGYWPCLYRRN